MKKVFLVFCMMLVSAVAFAQAAVEPVVPDGEIIDAILKLVTNWKVLGTLGGLSAILNILVMILKSRWCKNWFGQQNSVVKRALIVIIGQALSVIVLMSQGLSLVGAIVSGLIVSGGAMAIWEAVKPLLSLKKKEEVKAEETKPVEPAK